MKKLFILSFASILLLTGCGATETLSCSYRNTATNGTTKVTYDIDHQGDEVKKVRITYDYDFDNDVNNTNNNGNTNATNRTVVGDNNTNNNNNNNNNNATNNTNDNNNTTTNNGNTNDMTNNNGTTTYNNNDNDDDDKQVDGVGTGTDGTTNDTQMDDDGVVDGVVGSVIDTIVGAVTDTILDAAGLRDRHTTVQNTYGNVTGFSVQNTNDVDDNYKVTYVIDYDTISDNDLAKFNLSRNLDDLRNRYVNQGFTCK